MSEVTLDEITIRILRDLGHGFGRRTGLVQGKALTLWFLLSTRAGRIWVMCPTGKRPSEWCELEAGEWEEIR